MATRGFHSDWITIDDHRILLECRASFPSDEMKFVARVVVATCDSNSGGDARVTNIFYDDKACVWSIGIASDDASDIGLEKAVDTVLQTMFACGNYQSTVTVVKAGNKASDHYCHAEYLSIESGVAVDRFRHADKKYMDEADAPR